MSTHNRHDALTVAVQVVDSWPTAFPHVVRIVKDGKTPMEGTEKEETADEERLDNGWERMNTDFNRKEELRLNR